MPRWAVVAADYDGGDFDEDDDDDDDFAIG